jgi:hypothetical protein
MLVEDRESFISGNYAAIFEAVRPKLHYFACYLAAVQQPEDQHEQSDSPLSFLSPLIIGTAVKYRKEQDEEETVRAFLDWLKTSPDEHFLYFCHALLRNGNVRLFSKALDCEFLDLRRFIFFNFHGSESKY